MLIRRRAGDELVGTEQKIGRAFEKALALSGSNAGLHTGLPVVVRKGGLAGQTTNRVSKRWYKNVFPGIHAFPGTPGTTTMA